MEQLNTNITFKGSPSTSSSSAELGEVQKITDLIITGMKRLAQLSPQSPMEHPSQSH
jgi:hypothetical protein